MNHKRFSLRSFLQPLITSSHLSTSVHGVTSQKTVLVIVTAVRTSPRFRVTSVGTEMTQNRLVWK
jgi:hypothetical protein